jgi:hypothetical protein
LTILTAIGHELAHTHSIVTSNDIGGMTTIVADTVNRLLEVLKWSIVAAWRLSLELKEEQCLGCGERVSWLDREEYLLVDTEPTVCICSTHTYIYMYICISQY